MNEENRYAILIGNSRYRDDSGLLNLRCPENDVDSMAEILSDERYGGFINPVVLKNCTNYEAMEQMGEVFDRAGKSDLILVYYSGHGKQDIEGQLYLAAQNTKANSSLSLSNTAISVDTIRKNIRQSKTNKVILILDCCYSGAVGEAFLKGPDISVPLKNISEGRGTYILTASTSMQVASENEGDQNGLLTKHILEGIQTGDADIDNDGLISMEDLYDYVYKMVRREGQQTPMQWNLNVQGRDLAIARVFKPEKPVEEIINSSVKPTVDLRKLEAVGGAMALDSPYYVVRAIDDDFLAAIEKRESIVLVKGSRQIGKTSLLARGLQKARETGAKVAFIDFQSLNFDKLKTIDDFFEALATQLIKRLKLKFSYKDCWDGISEGSDCFRDFIIEVLSQIPEQIVWGMDEVDRLFSCDYGSEVFGLFRYFHNARATEPDEPWKRLTLALAYATEARLFIKDANQSPFNVGIRLELTDFSLTEVDWLNQKIKEECSLPEAPLRNQSELEDFYALLNGHPFLVRASLDAMVRDNLTWAEYKEVILGESGLFGEHLRRILELLHRDEDMYEAVKSILSSKPFPAKDSTGKPFPAEDIFYRLESSGLMTGKSSLTAKPRCRLYDGYLRKHLL